MCRFGQSLQFLSTPSARRATRVAILHSNPVVISIHALREEGDAAGPCWHQTSGYFYPRPPRGGRRYHHRHPHRVTGYFYPRPPRGGRLSTSRCWKVDYSFLSTPSARRATRCHRQTAAGGAISIHALREEGDSCFLWACPYLRKFLSTPSARRATFDCCYLSLNEFDFYPRPPRGGRHGVCCCAVKIL